MGKTSVRKPFPEECYYQPRGIVTSSTTARPNLLSLYDSKNSASPWMQTCSADNSQPKIICVANSGLVRTIENRNDLLTILEQFYLNHFKILLATQDKRSGVKKLYEVTSWPIPAAILKQVIDLTPQKMAKWVHQQDPHCSRDELYYLSQDNCRKLSSYFEIYANKKPYHNFDEIFYNTEGMELVESRKLFLSVNSNKRLKCLAECINLLQLEVSIDLNEIEEHYLTDVLTKISKYVRKECKLIFQFGCTISLDNMQKLNKIAHYLKVENISIYVILFLRAKEKIDQNVYDIINTQTELSIHGIYPIINYINFEINFEQGNLLSNFSVVGAFSLNFSNIKKTLENLKSISLRGYGMEHLHLSKSSLMELLRESPNLEYLQLKDIIYLEGPLTTDEVLFLLNLKNLDTLIISEEMVEPPAIELLRSHTGCEVILEGMESSWAIANKPDLNFSYVTDVDESNIITPDLRLDAKKIPNFQKRPYFMRFPKSVGALKNIRQSVYRFNPENCSFDSTPQSYTVLNLNVSVGFLNIKTLDPQLFSPYAVMNYNPGIIKDFEAGERVAFYTETPNDVLLRFSVQGNIGGAVFRIERGDNGLFYVTASKDLSAVQCQFLFGTPKENKETSPFPPVLLELEQRISHFGYDDRDLDESGYNNEEKIKEILKRRKGACRHRAQAFVYEFYRIRDELLGKGDASLMDYEIRMNQGGVHAWIEWRAHANEPFKMRDYLGGYLGKEHYQPAPSFSSVPAPSPSQPAERDTQQSRHLDSSSSLHLSLENPWANSALFTEIMEKSISPTPIPNISSGSSVSGPSAPTAIMITHPQEILSNLSGDGRNHLLCFESPTEKSAFIEALQAQNPRKVLHVYEPAQLAYTTSRLMCHPEKTQWILSPDGAGDLQLYFQNLQPDEQPIIVLNLEPADLVKYNSIIERDLTKRCVNGFKIPENTLILIALTTNSAALEDNSVLSRLHRQDTIRYESPAIPINASAHSCSLYHSLDWKALLLGYEGYDETGQPTVFPGYLSHAKMPLLLSHLPADPHFLSFISDLNANKGFWFLNQWIDFPYGIKLNKSNEYQYDDAVDRVNAIHRNAMVATLDFTETHTHLVNSHTFERCLRNIVVRDGKLCQYPGWVESAKGGELTLYINDPLTPGQWRCLLDTCHKHQVSLNVHLASDVSLPSTLTRKLANKITERPIESELSPKDPIIMTDDILSIDASELCDEDALYRYDVSGPQAECQRSDVLELLLAGKTVVFTGKIPAALMSHLSTLWVEQPYLWINGKKVSVSGKLILKPEDPVFIMASEDGPKKILPTALSDKEELDSWYTPEEYRQLVRKREDFIFHQLEDKPFVFLEGTAGSGKTSLILGIAEHRQDRAEVFYEDNIKAWANAPANERQKILFIDEANLRDGQDWTLFEGLYNNPPILFYKGKLYPLTSEHKVVFAGNPLTHGGARNLPMLFKRHPETLIDCPALPKAYLEHAIIRDIFRYLPESLGLDPIAEGRAFLEDYSLENGHIRDLQSRAILYVQEKITANSKAEETPFVLPETYLFVESRRKQLDHLKEILAIHAFKRCVKFPEGNRALLNAALYGGHSGLLLQGAPDTGKTALLLAGLEASGYRKVNLEDSAHEKAYYVMDCAHMDAILDRAFQEGAVLVWDEINTYLTPELNAKLNAYLSGHDMHKNPPQQPGFTFLSSINPAYLQGRVALDDALLSRLRVDTVAKYAEQDFRDILSVHASDLSPRVREEIFRLFLLERAKAKAEHVPMPGTRYLVDKVNECRKKGVLKSRDEIPSLTKNPAFLAPPLQHTSNGTPCFAQVVSPA